MPNSFKASLMAIDNWLASYDSKIKIECIDEWKGSAIVDDVFDKEANCSFQSYEDRLLFRIDTWLDVCRTDKIDKTNTEEAYSNSLPRKKPKVHFGMKRATSMDFDTISKSDISEFTETDIQKQNRLSLSLSTQDLRSMYSLAVKFKPLDFKIFKLFSKSNNNENNKTTDSKKLIQKKQRVPLFYAGENQDFMTDVKLEKNHKNTSSGSWIERSGKFIKESLEHSGNFSRNSSDKSGKSRKNSFKGSRKNLTKDSSEESGRHRKDSFKSSKKSLISDNHEESTRIRRDSFKGSKKSLTKETFEDHGKISKGSKKRYDDNEIDGDYVEIDLLSAEDKARLDKLELESTKVIPDLHGAPLKKYHPISTSFEEHKIEESFQQSYNSYNEKTSTNNGSLNALQYKDSIKHYKKELSIRSHSTSGPVDSSCDSSSIQNECGHCSSCRLSQEAPKIGVPYSSRRTKPTLNSFSISKNTYTEAITKQAELFFQGDFQNSVKSRGISSSKIRVKSLEKTDKFPIPVKI